MCFPCAVRWNDIMHLSQTTTANKGREVDLGCTIVKTPRLVTPRTSVRVADMLPTQTALPRNSARLRASCCTPWTIFLASCISSPL